MQNNLHDTWQKQPIVTRESLTEAELGRKKIVDIGVIKFMISANEAIVELCDGAYTQIQAEVIGYGTDSAQVSTAGAGQFVLVFFPYSNVNIDKGTYQRICRPFSDKFAKCLPIGLHKEITNIEQSTRGMSFSSDNFTTMILDSGVSVYNKDFTKCFNVNNMVFNAIYDDIEVELSEEGVKVKKGDTEIGIDTDGNVSLKAESIKLDGDVEITGSLDVAGGNFTVDK